MSVLAAGRNAAGDYPRKRAVLDDEPGDSLDHDELGIDPASTHPVNNGTHRKVARLEGDIGASAINAARRPLSAPLAIVAGIVGIVVLPILATLGLVMLTVATALHITKLAYRCCFRNVQDTQRIKQNLVEIKHAIPLMASCLIPGFSLVLAWGAYLCARDPALLNPSASQRV